jgi:rod shape-determining protein MreC
MSGMNPIKLFPALSTLVLLEIVAFFLVSYQIQVGPRLSLLERIALTLAAPFQTGVKETSSFFKRHLSAGKSLEELTRENQALKEKLADFNLTRAALEEERQRTARLQTLLNLKEGQPWPTVTARVIGTAHIGGDVMLTIDKGSRHGLKRESGVFSRDGVVGILWEVGPYHAKLMTLSHSGSAVAAVLTESRYREAYVRGRGGMFGRLENVPGFLTVALGEHVRSSGVDGLFPQGLPIGEVVAVQATNHMFQEIQLRFFVDYARLEEVLVLLPSEEAAEGSP